MHTCFNTFKWCAKQTFLNRAIVNLLSFHVKSYREKKICDHHILDFVFVFCTIKASNESNENTKTAKFQLYV